MASPPSKKLRRPVVVDSDDEDSTADSQLSTTSLNITARSSSLKKDPGGPAVNKRKATITKPKASKKSKTTKAKSTSFNGSAITKNASIYSFFNNSTTQSSSQNTVRARSPQDEEGVLLPDDTIEDISSDDAGLKASLPLPRRPKLDSQANEASNGKILEPSVVNKSKQFSAQLAESSVSQQDTSVQTSVISDAWIDLYPPESLSELVVHNRKVADVHKWLDNVVKGRERKRLLVLKGPSGSGKTATVRLLAKELGARVMEWENPVGSTIEEEGFVGLATQFDEFLTRSIQFDSLELADAPDITSKATQSGSRMLVLIEDFPNTFARGSSSLMSFRDSVLRYLVASTPAAGSRVSEAKITPVVMIVSETHQSGSTNPADSFTVNKLLGPQLLQHPSVTVIEFNPIAPGLLTKAISTIVRKVNRSNSGRWSPGTDLIKKISQSGDIRSSINSLQLSHLFNGAVSGEGQSTQFNNKKSSKKPPLKGDDQHPPVINFRDDVIDLFHAVGKILYNKRKDPNSEPIVQPPTHLRHHFRPRPSEVPIETVYNDIASDISTFISTLHENYPPSCHGEDFADSLDDCITRLSDADLILSSGTDNSSTRNLGRHPSSQLQSDYAFQIASRGLLFSLPYPVERGKTMSSLLSLGRDPFRMIYPTALRLWRTIDDNETVIDDWNDALLRDRAEHAISSDANTDTNIGPGPCSRISRADMVTQFLPYLAMIKPDLADTGSRNKRKSAMLAGGIDAEDDPGAAAPVLSSVLSLPLAFASMNSGPYSGNQTKLPTHVESLVLLDDDIEDD